MANQTTLAKAVTKVRLPRSMRLLDVDGQSVFPLYGGNGGKPITHLAYLVCGNYRYCFKLTTPENVRRDVRWGVRHFKSYLEAQYN